MRSWDAASSFRLRRTGICDPGCVLPGLTSWPLPGGGDVFTLPEFRARIYRVEVQKKYRWDCLPVYEILGRCAAMDLGSNCAIAVSQNDTYLTVVYISPIQMSGISVNGVNP